MAEEHPHPNHLTVVRHPTRRMHPYAWLCRLCSTSRAAGDTAEEAKVAFFRDHVPTDAHQRRVRALAASDAVLAEQDRMREEASRAADS